MMVLKVMNKWDQINSNYWNRNVKIRATDIENGIDITYLNTIVPYVMGFIDDNCKENDTILDVGCGCGYLTNKISYNYDVMGIDVSKYTVNYCKHKYPKVKFECQSIYNINRKYKFDLVIAIMVVHSLSDYKLFLKSVRSILKPGGKALFIIPHPCFWPFRKIELFNKYKTPLSIFFKIPFAIRNNTNYQSCFTYFHRDLSTYINTAISEYFTIKRIDELYEDENCKIKRNTPDLLAITLIN